MKIKAKVSFGGVLSMGKGEIREYNDQAVLSDLLKAGYIEEVKEEREEPAEKAGYIEEIKEEREEPAEKAVQKKKAVKKSNGNK